MRFIEYREHFEIVAGKLDDLADAGIASITEVNSQIHLKYGDVDLSGDEIKQAGEAFYHSVCFLAEHGYSSFGARPREGGEKDEFYISFSVKEHISVENGSPPWGSITLIKTNNNDKFAGSDYVSLGDDWYFSIFMAGGV